MSRVEWEALRQAIAYHDDLYFNKQSPEISDDVYDILKARFLWLSRRLHLDVDTVGKRSTNNAAPQITHTTRMLSIESAVGEDKLYEFLDRLESKHQTETYPVVAQHKIDGLAISLYYNNGQLVYGATRGDGSVGEDVTTNIRHLVPSTIPQTCDTFVRGEIYIPKQLFLSTNHSFTTARNAASGILRNITTEHNNMLRFLAYELLQPDAQEIALYTDALDQMRNLGFTVLDAIVCDTRQDCARAYHAVHKSRECIEYHIDGVVFKVNNNSMRSALGSTARTPKWAFACKFPAAEALTQVKRVVFQVGRTGVLTPVVEVQPTCIQDVSITRCSLHNPKMLREKDIQVGDTVVISRAGDVIPYLSQVLYNLRTGNETPVAPPTSCPSCSGDLVDDDHFIRCTSGWRCPDQVVGRLEYFLKSIGVKSLSVMHLRRFYSLSLVRSVGDLYQLTRADVEQIPGWGARSWQRLHTQLGQPVPLANIIAALGIDGVGGVTAKVLAAKYLSWEGFTKSAASDVAELRNLPGIGEKIAQNIADFLARETQLLNDVQQYVTVIGVESTTPQSKYTGQTWVITGTFDMPRSEIAARLESMGIKVASSVSSKTDVLLCGESPGSKLDRAKSLGVKILEMSDLDKLGSCMK